jgi:hypothetical protein
MSRGVLLIAVGHPNFAKMAFNLAISIKANSPNTVIALAHNYENLNFIDLRYRKNIDIDFFLHEKYYRHKQKNAFGMMKTLMYDFTPFEQTLYIDVDSLMIKDKTPDRFFYEIEMHDFIIPHGGEMNPATDAHDNHTHWVRFGNVKNFFKFQNCKIMGHCQSSIIGFKKCELSKQIFEKAHHVYNVLSERNIAENMWFSTVPDELCFWLAHGIVGYTPTYNPEPFILFSWELRNITNYRNVYEHKDLATFPSAMSLLKSYEKNFYNLLVSHYAEKTKLPPLYFWIDKRNARPLNDVRLKHNNVNPEMLRR